MVLRLALPAALIAAAAGAQTAADPRLVLAEAMQHIAALPAFSTDAAISMVVQSGERRQEQQLDLSLVFRGADDAYLHIKSQGDEAEVYRNASMRTVHLVPRKQYVEEAPPPSRADTIGVVGSSVVQLGARWLGDFLHANPRVLDGARSIASFTEGVAQGETGVRIDYADYTLRCRFAAGDAPVLRGFTIDAAAPPNASATATGTFSFAAWAPSPADDARFAFSPPPGVTKYTPPSPASRPGQSLVGQPVPALTLELLEGGSLDLAAAKGKQVVVLDFWASWCGPCRIGLPMVAEVSKRFEGKPVAFYAVNRNEPHDRIRAYLEKSKLPLPVALDPKDAAARAFQVTSIPRLVVIGKDGLVKHVHNGVSPNLRDELAKQLEALLAASPAVPS